MNENLWIRKRLRGRKPEGGSGPQEPPTQTGSAAQARTSALCIRTNPEGHVGGA